MMNDRKEKIKNLTLEELKQKISDLGEPAFRATQVTDWLYKKRAASFSDMSNVSKGLRELLEHDFDISSLRLVKEQRSRGGTRKLLFELFDDDTIESVLIPGKGDRMTLCVSSQAGCALGCTFCLTGHNGYRRNLTSGEMIDQVIEAEHLLPPDTRITNIVFMGMGEPFLNFVQLTRALRIITSPDALGFSPRRITVSTSGIVDRIPDFAELGLAGLAVSLNAMDNETRTSIMPVNKKHPLNKLITACLSYWTKTNDRVTFEYVLLGGVNDSSDHARKLCGLLSKIPCKINLIPFNECEGLKFNSPKPEAVKEFSDILEEKGYITLVRQGRGEDISAACGQLGGRSVGKEEEK